MSIRRRIKLQIPFISPDSANFDSPAFGGRSLNSLMLDRTMNPGEMSIVREILNSDGTAGPKNGVRNDANDVDTAIFQGGNLEYEIEGTRIVYDASHWRSAPACKHR